MNGAEALLRTLVACEVEVCFANPGTSEMHFVSALDRVPGMRPVLALAEGVATGAADGYARIAGRPAATLLHCGPGLANGLANLHNAQKAGVAIVNLIGDQAQLHRPLGPSLAAETENLARTVSPWTRTARDAYSVARDVAAAVAAARSAGGTIASLILPSDVCWTEGAQAATPQQPAARPKVDEASVGQAIDGARLGRGTVLLLGADALHGEALRLAGAVSRATGARLMCNSNITRIERGWDVPAVQRIPFGTQAAIDLLGDLEQLVLVGARRPVFGFAAPGHGPGRPEPAGLGICSLASAEEDVPDALSRMAAGIGAQAGGPVARPPQAEAAQGPVTTDAFAQSLVALMPEHTIVVDEGVTFGRSLFAPTAQAARHDWLQLTGGAIGSGLPMATGAAIAAPGRRVVSLQADGSALYTVQALWTQAREQLDVTTVVFSNRRYAILFDEMKRTGALAGPSSHGLFVLEQPAIDWLALARGFGVEAARAHSMEEFNGLFSHSIGRRGPFLIELLCNT